MIKRLVAFVASLLLCAVSAQAGVSVVATNLTGSDITVTNMGSVVIPANGTLTLTPNYRFTEVAEDDEIQSLIDTDKIALIIDGANLTKSESTALSGSSTAVGASILRSKKVLVKTVSDFGVPNAAGRITLASNTLFEINGMITTTNRLLWGTGVRVAGGNISSDVIVYTGTNTFLTISNNNGVVSDFTVSAPSGRFFECVSTSGLHQVNVRDLVIADTKHIGRVKDLNTFAINNVSVRNITSSGITFQGTNGTRALVIDSVFDMMTATGAVKLIDPGTSTWDVVHIDRDEFLLPTNFVAVTGATNSFNIKSNGLGRVSNGSYDRVSGTGPGDIFVTGIQRSDSRWSFVQNANLTDSSIVASIANTNTLITVAVDQNVSTNIPGPWAVGQLERFTAASNGTLTYTGRRPATLRVSGSAVLEPASGNNQNVSLSLAKNGAPITLSRQIAKLDTGAASSITVFWIISVVTGDEINLFTGNRTSGNDVRVTGSVLIVGGQ
jgi:hypothetical protein